jgi:hypothetical protein
LNVEDDPEELPMTSREIILANLNHAGPVRPGLNFDRGRIDDLLWGGLGPSPSYTPRRWTEGEHEFYDDEWGNVWVRMMAGCASGEIHAPALDDWGKLDTLRLPDWDHPARYEAMQTQFAAPTDKFKIAFLPGWVFATSRYLRKMEVYFVDLIEHREEIDLLHEKIAGLLERVIRRVGACGADGIIFCEDLGVQDRTLISPTMWRDVLDPHYRRLTAAAHECGMKVFMHSCGYNWALLDDLAAAGIDCFQFDQPAAYDQAALADKLKALRVALWSPVDIQQVLPTGDRARIEAEAARMVELFGGFLIAKNYPDLHGIGVDEAWDAWAYQAFLRAAGVAI